LVPLLGVALLVCGAGSPSPDQLPPPCDQTVTEAVRAADDGRLARADSLLSAALESCPRDPRVLREAAGLRFREGRFGEAEELALRLLRVEPGSSWAWEVVGSTRYLDDDPLGALRAWNQVGRPVIREIRIDGPGGDHPALARATGLSEGLVLTPSRLTRGERALWTIPAVSRARLDYRPVPGGGGRVEGAVTLGPNHPFDRLALPAHGLRALGGTARLTASNPLGWMERWQAEGLVEGRFREAVVSLAHPVPRGRGTVRWELGHSVGRFGDGRTDTSSRLERSGVAATYGWWASAAIRGRVTVGLDHWAGLDTFARAGAGMEVRPSERPWTLRWEGEGWAGPGARDRFGRAGLMATHLSLLAEDTDLEIRLGLDAISRNAPLDLYPRFGAGRSATRLLRAHSLLDSEGVIHPLHHGSSWAHGGVELRRWARTGFGALLGGAVTLGGALFADMAHTLSNPDGRVDGAAAVHLGTGLRARAVGLPGWLRADWAIDARDGSFRFSAAWMNGA